MDVSPVGFECACLLGGKSGEKEEMAVSENKVHSDKQGQRIQIKDNRGGKTVQRKSGKRNRL